MCVIRYVHACGHVREVIHSTLHNPQEMCICGRLTTQDCTDALCESNLCNGCPSDMLFPIATTFDQSPMSSASLTLEEELAVLDAERHGLNVAHARVQHDAAAAQEELRILTVDMDLIDSRFAAGEAESVEGREARRRTALGRETVEMEIRLHKLRADLSKVKLDENEAQIRRVRETMDEVHNAGLDAFDTAAQMVYEQLLQQDVHELVQKNQDVAMRARETMVKEMEARRP